MLLLPLPPPLKQGLSPFVSPLLLIARICRQINHNQSCTWPWSKAEPEEKLLGMTHRALEPWHELIDPMMGVKEVSFSGLPQRVIARSYQRGRCQDCKTASKWLPGNVHSVKVCALRVETSVQKTLPHRPGECYDVIGGLGCFQTSKWDPRRGGFDGLLHWGTWSWDDRANFLLFSVFAGFVAAIDR